MIQFLRQNKVAMWILTVIRVYLGWLWLQAGWEKLTANGGFHAESIITGAIQQGTGITAKLYPYPWFVHFLNATTNHGHDTSFFNFIVPWGEFFVGLGLIFGTFTLAAAFFGLLMNFTFLLSGVIFVNATFANPTYIFFGIFVLIGGFNSGKIGLDYWITPFLRQSIPFLNNDIELIKNS